MQLASQNVKAIAKLGSGSHVFVARCSGTPVRRGAVYWRSALFCDSLERRVDAVRDQVRLESDEERRPESVLSALLHPLTCRSLTLLCTCDGLESLDSRDLCPHLRAKFGRHNSCVCAFVSYLSALEHRLSATLEVLRWEVVLV